MPVNYTKDDYTFMARIRLSAFQAIADKLGKTHPITKMMDTLAWGRHHREQGVNGNLRTAIAEKEYLDGCFNILNTWARDNDRDAQKVMLSIYPRGMKSVTNERDRGNQ